MTSIPLLKRKLLLLVYKLDSKKNLIMKNTYKIGLLLSVILMGSCSDELDPQPAQSISEELALTNPENIEAVLVGAYDELGVNDLFGGNTLRNSELLAATNELLWAGTFNGPAEMYDKAIQVVNGDVSEVWLEAYETINITNNVLSGLDNFEDQDRADAVEGGAKFIRALVYFELVKFFGLPYEAGVTNSQFGVPIVLNPTRELGADAQVERNTVEQVYAQILADLDDAIAKLPSDNDVFASSGAARALRARVKLQMSDYDDALADANAVITSDQYALVTSSFADVFNRSDNSSEDVFAIQVSSQDGVNSMNTFWATPQFGGRDGDIIVLDNHVALYPAGDDRGTFFYDDGGTFTSKYTDQFGNIPVIRLAEMYLIRAECNIRLGIPYVGDDPLADINLIRDRANAPALISVALNDVLMERRLELAFEGHRLHDIKRTGSSVGTIAYNSGQIVFPIPAREINANPKLEQNDYYK